MTESPRRPTKRARELRNSATPHEHKLWLELRKRRFGGHKFSRQIPVGPYICDFVCRRRKLVIELDGGQHSANAQRDASRTRYIESAGFRVIRFWNNELDENLEGVLSAIAETIEACPEAGPPPCPFPVGEGET